MAHIPDGFLSAPVLAGTAALSTAALAVAVRRSRHELDDRRAPLLGALTAFVFAAQLLNFPLAAGASGHLLGGVLVAVLAGPWAGMLTLFSVLLVQALLFQDGGIAALGANTLNLAVIGCGGGYLVYRWQLAILGDGRRGRLAAAGIAAFLTTLATGLAAGLELGWSGLVPTRTAVLTVGGAHAILAAVEAALTVGILGAVLRSRPGLARDTAPAAPVRAALAVATAAVVMAAVAAVWASSLPDPLETAMATLGLHPDPASSTVTAPADALVGSAGAMEAEWLPAVLGTVAVFAMAALLARALSRARTGGPVVD